MIVRSTWVAVGLLALVLVGACSSSESPKTERLARAPFKGLTEKNIRVGTTDLLVVVDDTESERSQGLRGRRHLGGYDGMLFEYPSSTTATFTMSTVPVGLDVGFYDAQGKPVDRLAMTPCSGSEFDCPSYRSRRPFRYALETLPGDLPRGALRLRG